MPTPDDYNSQPGYRNFNAPPGTPGYFTVANPSGGPPLPNRTTESSTRNGNPQATQTAAAPPPPGVPVGTTYPPLPGQPPPPAKPGENIDQPTPPTPADAKPSPPPEPAAKPLPNLGAWTPDQAKPWMHVKPIAPQQVPDRPPDTHVGTRPAYHPRPGEPGYTTGPQQPGQPYTFGMFLGKALQHGFTGQAAYDMAAIGLAESQGYANRVHVNDGGKGFNSYGALQINGSNDAALIKAGFPGGARAALDIDTAFAEAYVLSKGGTDFSPWSTFNDKSYLRYLDGNARPEASSTLVVGPRQDYRPPPGREPGQWGAPVEHDWTPGNMPTAHDIPGILGALLPIAIAGVLGGGGLGMIAAYAGYQNARNKAQTEEAKQQKTLFQDRLKETEAGLKSELLEASGLWAQYGDDYTSPAAQQAWAELAAKYGDTQLRAALESGGKGVEQLFKKRDEAFQTIGKVSAAQTKADEQEQKREQDQRDENAMGFPGTTGGGGTGAPAGPEKPWENAPTPQAGGPPVPPPTAGGGSAAGAPPGGAPPAVPAAAPAEQPTAPPAPEEQPPEEPAPPGTPSATLPPVNVNAPAEQPPPTAGAPRTPFDAMVSQVVNGEEVEKFKPSIPADGLRKLQAAAADKINRIEAVKAGPNAAAQLKAIDPTFGNYAEGVANYTMPDPTSRANVGRDYVARMYAAAQKINPQWNYQDFTTKQEFRTSFNPDKNVGKTLSRTSRLVNLSRELSDDAEHLPNTNVASFNQLIAWFQGGKIGDARYTKFITDWRLFANEAQAVASGTGTPPVTLTSHMIDTLQQGATPPMIRQGLKEDLQAALGSIDPNLSGWHRQFPGQANPAMFDQGVYSELNQYAHMNIDTGAVPEALPEVGYSQQWGGQTHYYLGGDITNKLNWSTQKPPGGQ